MVDNGLPSSLFYRAQTCMACVWCTIGLKSPLFSPKQDIPYFCWMICFRVVVEVFDNGALRVGGVGEQYDSRR